MYQPYVNTLNELHSILLKGLRSKAGFFVISDGVRNLRGCLNEVRLIYLNITFTFVQRNTTKEIPLDQSPLELCAYMLCVYYIEIFVCVVSSYFPPLLPFKRHVGVCMEVGRLWLCTEHPSWLCHCGAVSCFSQAASTNCCSSSRRE